MIMTQHKLILQLSFILICFLAVANSFLAETIVKRFGAELSISQSVIGVFLILFLIYNYSYSDKEYWKFMSPLFLLTIYALVSSIWSPFPIVAIVFSFKLLFIINIFILASNMADRNLLRAIDLVVLAKLVIIITVLGQIIGHIIGINVYNSKYSTAGLSDNASIVSAQLLFCIPALFLGNFKRKTDFLFLFMVITSILFTFRRSAMISLLLVLAIVFILNLFSSASTVRKRLHWTLIALIVCLFIIFFLLKTSAGGELMSRLVDLDLSQGGTASGRYEFQWLGLMYCIKRDFLSSLIGEGFGSSILVNINNGFIPIGMHSDFLDIIIGLGIIGVTMYMWFLKRLFDQNKKHLMVGPFFNSSISFFVAIVSLGFFSGGFFEMNTILGYFSMGYVFSAKNHNQ